MISVIVPVYNVEKYIEDCIQSILQQTYKDFELLLIDDGSPDNSGIICNRFADGDCRIRVIHKENQGVSAARNDGLALAKGEYVCFIDSDDYVDENYLSLLANNMVSGGMAACKMYSSGDAFQSTHRESLKQDEAQISCFSAHGMGGCVGGKLYDAEIIRTNVLKFEESLTICEDLLFVIQYLQHVTSNVVWNYSALYYYRPNQEGAVKRRFRLHKNYSVKELSEVTALELCHDYLLPNQEVHSAWRSRMVKASVNTIRTMTANQIEDEEKKNSLMRLIRHNTMECMKSKYLAISSKVSILACSVSPKLEQMIWNIRN